MTIFTNRELERVASLRMNWRKEFLLELVRLRHERDAVNIRPSADNSRTTSWPAWSQPATGSSHN